MFLLKVDWWYFFFDLQLMTSTTMTYLNFDKASWWYAMYECDLAWGLRRDGFSPGYRHRTEIHNQIKVFHLRYLKISEATAPIRWNSYVEQRRRDRLKFCAGSKLWIGRQMIDNRLCILNDLDRDWLNWIKDDRLRIILKKHFKMAVNTTIKLFLFRRIDKLLNFYIVNI